MRAAYDYLKTAVDGYEKESMAAELVKALQTMSSIDQILNRNDQANGLLQRAVEASARLGSDSLAVKSRLLAAQGRLARAAGHIPESRAYFKEALVLFPREQGKTTGDLALASISMGEAMLEAGRKEEARELFLKGLTGSENASYLLNDCLNAPARAGAHFTEQGNYEEALAYSPGGRRRTRGVLPADHAFGPGCMTSADGSTSCASSPGSPCGFPEGGEQRGGLSHDCRPVPRGPGEGVAGRRGRGKGAGNLRQSIQVRESNFSSDTLSLGRVYHSLGIASDMEGDREGALQAYSRAVDALLKCGDGPERKNLLVQSYLCKAYALCDGEQWQEAVYAFEAVLPLLEGEQRSENYKQLGRCYDELGMTAKADECWKESGFPRVRRSSPVRRTDGGRISSRR